MMIEVEFAELHSPFILAGTNFQTKLDPTKRDGLVLQWDDERNELHVHFKDKTAKFSSSSVHMRIEGKVQLRPGAKPNLVQGKIEAQASSPQAHVFEGPGKGKTK